MRKDILKLIGEIQVLAVQISTRTKHDVFVKYFGHVNAITVEFYRYGYGSSSSEEKICDLYMRHHTNAEIKSELKKTKRILEVLKSE